jgi:hypothetical protein
VGSMNLEELRKEYEKKVNLTDFFLLAKLTDNYPAEIYMIDPEHCSDHELVEQCLGKPKLYCIIDENHSEADFIPLQRIIRNYYLESVRRQDVDESYLKVYEGSFSQTPKICLWSVLREHKIIPKTAKLFSDANLYTSPHAVKIIVYNIAKPENALKAEKIIDECINSSLDKYF